MEQTGKLNRAGREDAPVLVVTDAPPPHTYETGGVMSAPQMELLRKTCQRHGIPGGCVQLLTPCPPVPDEAADSDRKTGEFLAAHRDEFLARLQGLQSSVRAVVTMGGVALRQLSGRPVKITSARGTFTESSALPGVPVLPVFSPAHVLRRPEAADVFDSDFAQLAVLRDAGWDAGVFARSIAGAEYEWCLDLSPLLDEPPSCLALDVETMGFSWHGGRKAILTVQVSVRPGHAYVIPLDAAYFNNRELRGESSGWFRGDMKPALAEGLRKQLKRVLERKGTRIVGHNLKFDIHHLRNHGIDPAPNWFADTMQLAFAVDENMERKSLNDCVRRWVPEMAGYCLAPDARVLASDLRHVAAGDLKVGDKLLAFDEEAPSGGARRKMREATVTSAGRTMLPCYRVKTSMGREIVVSADHKFLNKNFKGGNWKWRKASELRVGHALMPFPWESPRTDYDGGYMGGIYDGEGYVTNAKGTGMRMGFAQLKGPVLDKAMGILRHDGFGQWVSVSEDLRKPVVNVVFSSASTLRAMQLYRPARLVGKKPWEGKSLPRSKSFPSRDFVTEIEFLGVREVVSLSTSTKTLVAEGLCQHNSDAFDADPVHDGKAHMERVPHDKMIRYAGGDTDATFRLMTRLSAECRKDSRQWNCFLRVQMPALRAFVLTEENGIRVDKGALRSLGNLFDRREEELYRQLMAEAAKKAPAVLRRHEEAGLAFSRDAFVADLLFSPDGFGLKPLVFTPSTRRLPPDQRVPSVSTKEHLPFFDHVPFVAKLTEYQRLAKMRSTYVGREASREFRPVARLKNGRLPKAVEEGLAGSGVPASLVPRVVVPPVRKRGGVPPSSPVFPLAFDGGRVVVDSRGLVWRSSENEPTGFWQYLTGGDELHPTYRLDNTVTGRSSGQSPNPQNIPKRDPVFAPAFRRCFVPRPGRSFVSCDLSQAELRFAAWMANESRMLKIYRDGGDIHAATAAGIVGKPVAEVTKAERQSAKAVNFGFLFGMWWRKFKDYAKTDYGVTFTDKQAEAVRDRFFSLYPALEDWHADMRRFVREHGFVRSLHGALRRLPSINSDDEGMRAECERQAINSPIQRIASDAALMGMARFVRDCPREVAGHIAFIHDDNVFECAAGDAERVAGWLRFYMESIPWEPWFGIRPPLPLTASASIGHGSLADMEERPDIAAVRPPWHNAGADAE